MTTPENLAYLTDIRVGERSFSVRVGILDGQFYVFADGEGTEPCVQRSRYSDAVADVQAMVHVGTPLLSAIFVEVGDRQDVRSVWRAVCLPAYDERGCLRYTNAPATAEETVLLTVDVLRRMRSYAARATPGAAVALPVSLSTMPDEDADSPSVDVLLPYTAAVLSALNNRMALGKRFARTYLAEVIADPLRLLNA